MSCPKVRKSLSAFMDVGLSEDERESVSRHLASCRECCRKSQELLGLRTEVRELPMVAPPWALTTRLRVLASHERSRRLSRLSFSAAVRSSYELVKLRIDNMMRPLAVPFAGGLLSAVCLFGMLVPTLTVPHNIANDPPTRLYTDPAPASEQTWRSLQLSAAQAMAPLDLADDEITVELQIDARGRVVGYSVPDSKVCRALLTNIGSLMLFSNFYPATLFFHPTSGRVFVSFRHSRIVVKG